MADPIGEARAGDRARPVLRYGIGVAVLVLAILSQYIVPPIWPASRAAYDTLLGGFAIVYAVPIAAFALLVGVGPVRRWKANPRQATVVGLGWYGVMGLLALVVTIVLTVVYELVDPAALQLLQRPNPELQAAASDPWLYVGISFVVGAFEETLFRGWVFGFWIGRTPSWLTPAVLSSLLFAGLHLYYGTTYGIAAPLIFPTLFLIGFAFAATYRSSGGNLVVPAALHGAFDASAFLTLVSVPVGVTFRYLLFIAGAIVGLPYFLHRSDEPPPTAPSALPAWPGVEPPTRSSGTPGSAGPMPPSDEELRRVLANARTVAVVGLSDRSDRDSNEVARYLQANGYRIVPVNPQLSEVLGERAYLSLTAIPSDVRVDLVVIFRRSEFVPPIVREAMARGIPAVWMQLGITNPAAAGDARAHGLFVVEDTCSMTTHRRLGVGPVIPA